MKEREEGERFEVEAGNKVVVAMEREEGDLFEVGNRATVVLCLRLHLHLLLIPLVEPLMNTSLPFFLNYLPRKNSSIFFN